MTPVLSWLASLLGVGVVGLGVAVDLPPAHTFVEDDGRVSQALADELSRSMKELKLGDSPRPYYLAYALSDAEQASVVATFGAVTSTSDYRGRSLRTDVRVGSPAFDNSNTSDSFFSANVAALPVDDDYAALRRELWLRTDEAYKSAVETLAKKKSTAAGQSSHGEDGEVADFSSDVPAKLALARTGPAPDVDVLRPIVEALSAVFRGYPQISVGRATAVSARVRRRFVSSEGGLSDEENSTVRVDVVAETQAPDGMRLVDFVPFTALTPEGLPPLIDMQRAVRHLADELVAMMDAPVAATGTASVLFEGLAAGQIAKLLIADNLSGTPAPRTASGNDERGQSSEFSDRLGQKVGAPLLMVADDPLAQVLPLREPVALPALISAGGVRPPPWGAYRIDDEGIPARAVSIIEQGILKGLLMTRTPRKELAHSNGHARATRFGPPKAAVGTLLVSSRPGDPRGALPRASLLAEMLRAGRVGSEASYVVRLLDDPMVPGVGSVDDGFAMISMGAGAGRSAPSVKPLVVYRVRPDGKEELVRGLTLEGLVPRSLRDIVAMGRDPVVYNFQEGGLGFVGIPQTIVSPALFFADVDVRRSVGKNRRPPLYPRPDL